jgi:acyl carrier protein
MTVSREEIEEKVTRALCTSLALDRDQVRSDSRLITDLDMNSLDFLDLMFSLESEFAIRMRDADFDRLLRPDRSEVASEQEFLTETEIEALAPILPGVRDAALDGPVPRNKLFSFVTVDTLVRLVARKLEQGWERR